MSSSALGQEALYSALINAMPGVAHLLKADAPRFTIVATTPKLLQTIGVKKEAVIGKGIFEAFPSNPSDVADTGESNLRASLLYVLLHKQSHQLSIQRYDVMDDKGQFVERYWRAENSPVLSPTGEVLYILQTSEDITDQVKAEKREKQMVGIEKAYQFFMNAPVSIGIVRGDDYIIDLANEGLLQIWGKSEEVIGQPLTTAVPELAEQGYTDLLDQVRNTGEPFYAYEYPITLNRNGKEEVLYFDFVYKPFYENETDGKATGVISVGHDVTEQVLARQKVEEVTERLNFRNALFEAQNETTPDGVLIVDAKGKILLYNKRFAQIWSMPQDIIDSKDDDAALRHAMTMLTDPQGFIDKVTQLYKTKKEKSYDQIQFKDGRIIERFGTSITAENGLYYGWAWYFKDISERKKQEEAIDAQNVLIRTITDNATSTLFMMNAKGFCTFMNAAGEKMFGYSQEEIRSKPLHYLIHHHRPDGSHYPMEECPLDRALPENFDVRAHKDLFFRKDGSSFPITCAASPIFENGVPVATVIEVRDISLELEAEQALHRSAAELEQLVGERTKELEKANEALMRTNQELARSNTNLEEFAHAASHDMKEPIRKVLTFTDRLKMSLQTRLTETEKQLFDRVENATQRMGLLVDDLLEFSHVSERPLEKEEVNLNVKVRKVLTDLELLIEEKNAKVELGLLPTIKGYKRQLQQLFHNLIGNALKYSKQDHQPMVTVTSKTVHGYEVADKVLQDQAGQRFHLIEVHDNGIGFEPEYAERIFGMFQRLHGKAEYPGTGVGLSIARKVVENHNGYIWAESQPNVGATFKVLLPAD